MPVIETVTEGAYQVTYQRDDVFDASAARTEIARTLLSVEEQNRSTIFAQAVQALTDNAAFLAIGSPSAAQNAAQVKALTRQTNKLIRLVIGRLDATS